MDVRSLVMQSTSIAKYIIPPQAEREPVTLSNSQVLALPLIATIIMASLARTPNTWPIRLALLPVSIACTLRVCFGHVFEPSLNGLNGLLGTP